MFCERCLRRVSVLGGCSTRVALRQQNLSLSPNVLWELGTPHDLSKTLRNQVYVISQVRRCLAGQRRQRQNVKTPYDKLSP